MTALAARALAVPAKENAGPSWTECDEDGERRSPAWKSSRSRGWRFASAMKRWAPASSGRGDRTMRARAGFWAICWNECKVSDGSFQGDMQKQGVGK